jgi:hypothetical protein
MPTSASKAATAVSQDAGINSAFYLQYFQPSNRWAFARMDADAVLAASSRVLSNAAPTLNTWTHLVGVYNASTLDVYLYVDGSLQGAVLCQNSSRGLNCGNVVRHLRLLA